MNLEEYKKKVKESLEKEVGTTRADTLMKNYNEDFPMFLEKSWSPDFTAFAMVQGY